MHAFLVSLLAGDNAKQTADYQSSMTVIERRSIHHHQRGNTGAMHVWTCYSAVRQCAAIQKFCRHLGDTCQMYRLVATAFRLSCEPRAGTGRKHSKAEENCILYFA